MILTLTDVAERLGVTAKGRHLYAAIVRKVRLLEQHSGRSIIVASGVGRGRRYLVLERELDAALEGDRRDVEQLAERIAEGVQRIEQRVQDLSVRVGRIERGESPAY